MMTKSQGFTLIELIVTLTVVAVLATVGLPNMMSLLQNNRINTATTALMASLNYARGEAITQHDNRGVNISLIRVGDTFSRWLIWRDCTDAGLTTDCPKTTVNTVNRATDDNGTYDADTSAEVIREFTVDAPIFMVTADWLKIDANRTLPATVTAITAANTLNFGADGRLSTTENRYEFWLCDARVDEPISRLRIFRTGRIAVRQFYPSDTEYFACPS